MAKGGMVKLYGSAASRAHRVLWMLKELNVPFEHIPTPFLDGSTHRPDFLRINPNGRVPVLEDDGLIVFESLAINLYLAKKYPTALSPATLAEEALVTQWSIWVITEIEKALLLASANAVLFDEQARQAGELEVALAKLDRPWRVLDAHLERQPFLVGGRFTVADLNLASVMSLAPLAGISLAAYSRMQQWLMSCLERPAGAEFMPTRFRVPRPPTHLEMLKAFV